MHAEAPTLAAQSTPQPVEARVEAAPARCVIVIDEALAPGKAANAAAVIAFTLGQRHPQLVGPALEDAEGAAHPGLIPIGIPVLSASAERLTALRTKALGFADVVDFPVQGQQTTDYQAFRAAVQATPGNALAYLAVGLVGPRNKISKLVGGFALFA